MRRWILVLGVVFCLASVISLSSITNAVQAELPWEIFTKLLSATPEPLQTLEPRFSVDDLLEIAEENARALGLGTFDGEPEWVWITRDSDSILSGVNTVKPNAPLFKVSFRGSGIWLGIHGPRPINGVTLTINGLTGELILAAGGHRSLSQADEAVPEPEIIIEPRFSTEEMLELAEAAAHDYGLETIDGEPEWIWTTRYSEISGFYGLGILNPTTPLFMASFHGTGFWGGAGCPGCGLIPIYGMTVMIDGLTGNALQIGGGYMPLLSTPIPEITIEPEYTAEPEPTATHVPVTPPPYALSEAELVAIAKDNAVLNGLETFDGPPLVAWMTQAKWDSTKGLSYGYSQRGIVFVVSFRGTGEDRGFGGGFASIDRGEPHKLNGLTVVLSPRDGLPYMMLSGFYAPPFATEYADWAEIE
jgi:hypothetical protein